MRMNIRRMAALLAAVLMVSPVLGCTPAETEKDRPLTDELYPKNGSYTSYVTRSKYNMSTSMPVDSVSVRPETIGSFPTGYDVKTLSGGACANQDVYKEYTSGKYDGKTHEEDVFHTKDGQRYGYSLLSGIPYMLPTDSWNRFLLDQLSAIADLGVTRLGLSEQGIWGSVGYEQGFRDLWKREYGEEWQYFWDDPELYYKAQRLKSKLMLRQVDAVFGPLKQKDSKLTLGVGTHTSLAYYSFTNPIANHDTFASPYVDYIQGQTWSNTMELPISYDGGSMARPFINGYVDYSYWANLGRQFPSKTVSFIIDAKGDGYDGKTLEFCEEMYRQQLTAQLIFSSVCHYDFEWPDRSYSAGYTGKPVSTDDYRTVINNITSLQGQMYRYTDEVTTPNRPLRVGAVLLDTSCFQAGAPGNTVNNNSYYGMLTGLMYKGLLVDAVPMGELSDETDILGGYDILLVSFDLMKPESDACIRRLADYVRGGGTLIYMGGAGEYEDLSFSWWKKEGLAAPQEKLLSLLDIRASGRTAASASSLRPESSSALASVGEITQKIDKARIIGYSAVEGASVSFRTDGGLPVMWEKQVGKGRFFYWGMDPSYFCMRGTGDTLWALVKAVAAEKKTELTAQKAISYRRGPVYGIHALTEDVTTEKGIWLDPFDAALPVLTEKTVKAECSTVLLDVSDKYQSQRPVVLYAQGNNPTVIENRLHTRIVTAGPQDTTGTVRIYIPEGHRISALTAVNAVAQKDVLIDSVYDAETKSILITYRNNVSKVIVDVEYIKSK